MQTRIIPSTSESIPVIGLGTYMSFDMTAGTKAFQNQVEVYKKFYSLGGRLLDSSPMYGLAEEAIGHIVPKTDSIFYATKVWTRGKDSGIQQMNESFKKMKTEKIDLMQIHNLIDWKTHLKTLRDWKERGKIRYIGITHYVSSAFSQMETIMKTEPIDFIQIPYSVETRDAENRILPLAKERKIAVLVNRPFEGGSIFHSFNNKKLPDYFSSLGCKTVASVFLKYILSEPAVTCIIPATTKLQHMKDNMEAGFSLPEKSEQKNILKYLKELS
ncbi:MAG: aldo/keto reductase [Leptospiraceae bacterium]|nr:aldo/keto reductase [Leptospiraceae bacterium]